MILSRSVVNTSLNVFELFAYDYLLYIDLFSPRETMHLFTKCYSTSSSNSHLTIPTKKRKNPPRPVPSNAPAASSTKTPLMPL